MKHNYASQNVHPTQFYLIISVFVLEDSQLKYGIILCNVFAINKSITINISLKLVKTQNNGTVVL